MYQIISESFLTLPFEDYLKELIEKSRSMACGRIIFLT